MCYNLFQYMSPIIKTLWFETDLVKAFPIRRVDVEIKQAVCERPMVQMSGRKLIKPVH